MGSEPSGPGALRGPSGRRVLSLFAGLGGFDLGLEAAGWESAGQVEIDPYCSAVLAKHWPHVKRMADIRDVKGDEFGPIDLICGGFPCQPFSTSGKRLGKEDDRYLWPEMRRVIEAVRPRWVIAENVLGIASMAIGQVLSDLEALGYDFPRDYDGTIVIPAIPACAVGAYHERARVWPIAHLDQGGRVEWADPSKRRGRQDETAALPAWVCAPLSDLDQAGWADGEGIPAATRTHGRESAPVDLSADAEGDGWAPEPGVGILVHGVPKGLDEVGALGNAVVPRIPEILGRLILSLEGEALPERSSAEGSNP
jgi:DNA (cytosine-5)-methyltransferase 1